MRIPHSFDVAPVAAPRVRSIDHSNVMRANALMEQADQGLIKGVDTAVQTGNEIYQDHIQKQYTTDMIAGGAMRDQMKIKRDEAIGNIPVDSSVDYDREVKLINEDYNKQWEKWAGENIRNKDHPLVRQARQQSVDEFRADGDVTSARLGVMYENARNESNLDFDKSISMRALTENLSD